MRVFKYLHPGRINILNNQSIRFTQSESLNDRFELRPEFSQIAHTSDNEYLKSMGPFLDQKFGVGSQNELPRKAMAECLMKIKPSVLQQIDSDVDTSSFLKNFRDTMGVLSLTKRFDNQLMWAHYADSHKGIVLEFDPSSDFFKNPYSEIISIRTLQDVKYVLERPILNHFDYVHPTPTDIENLCMAIFFTKSKAWESEQEVRFIKTLDPSKTEVFNGEEICLFDFESTMIKSIYMGCRASVDLENKVSDLLSEPRYSHVSLYKEVIEVAGYEINFKQTR